MKHYLVLIFAVLTLTGCNSNNSNQSSSSSDVSGLPQNSQEPDADVIIIGAGIAGLSAAKYLQENGKTVLLLEARDRVGGRVWSNREIEGLPLDMGASWIHGVEGNPINQLAQQLELPLQVTDYDNQKAYSADGSVNTSLDSNQTLIEQELNSVSMFTSNSTSVGDVVEEKRAALNAQGVTNAEIGFFTSSAIEQEYAADIEELSVFALEEGEAFGGEDVVFDQGYDGIVNYLATDLTIKLNQVVTQVDYSSTLVSVHVENGVSYSAKKVLSTVPLGVLQKGAIQFSPELPENKQTAIDSLGMGLLGKVYLKFPAVFWDQNHDWIGFVGEKEGQWNSWLNIAKYNGQPILMAFTAGEFGRHVESMEESEVIAEVMTVLKTIYGENIPSPESYLITRWHNDPFAYGSYSFLKVGADADMRVDLAESVNDKLFFAGEATSSSHPSTVHGAYQTGQREAQNIIDAL